MELINEQWYWLEWDSNPKYLGYWVKKKDAIDKGYYNLGHPDMEPPTPIQTQLEESAKAWQRAESSSTQASGQKSLLSSNDDPVDKDLAWTEQLAAILEGNLIFQDIAEAVEPSGPREHYMPAYIPKKPTRGLGPVPLNPIRVRATRGTKEVNDTTLAATKEAACLITNRVKLDGHLKGRVPDTFDGDQTKAQNFLNQFDLFWLMNDDATTMTNPFKRCIYFLGLIHGPRVEDWVVDQVSVLKEITTQDNNQIPKTSE